jgi:hypothetical protein
MIGLKDKAKDSAKKMAAKKNGHKEHKEHRELKGIQRDSKISL